MTLAMLRLTRRLSLLLVIFLALAACGHSDDPLPSPIALTESASGSTVALRQGQILTVSLQENSSTGFTWEIQPGYESFLSQQGASQYVADSSGTGIAGAGGVRTFKFLTIASGNFTLKLIYRQPWMTGVAPAKTFEVAIAVGG